MTTSILSVTGSDNSGWSGLQLDVRIITEMGCHALTAATCIVMQNDDGITDIVDFPDYLVKKQVAQIVADFQPKAVKIGLVRTPVAVGCISDVFPNVEMLSKRNKIVVAPGIMSSNGTQLIPDDTIDAIKRYLIPKASLLMLRQVEAERILNISIVSNEDMLNAARVFADMGAEYVMLRGAKIIDGRIVALLYGRSLSTGDEEVEFFSSYNVEGWQQHGVGGALSTAITTRMGMGDDVPTAIKNAHEYVHSRIVYSVMDDKRKLRPADIYNTFMNLISDNYRVAHDVQFYADKLNITTRYLSLITNAMVSKSPKQIIAEYVMREACQVLENSRLSVKEISVTLGFSTLALFCKFFKQQSGQTPSEYRLSVGSLS